MNSVFVDVEAIILITLLKWANAQAIIPQPYLMPDHGKTFSIVTCVCPIRKAGSQ